MNKSVTQVLPHQPEKTMSPWSSLCVQLCPFNFGAAAWGMEEVCQWTNSQGHENVVIVSDVLRTSPLGRAAKARGVHWEWDPSGLMGPNEFYFTNEQPDMKFAMHRKAMFIYIGVHCMWWVACTALHDLFTTLIHSSLVSALYWTGLLGFKWQMAILWEINAARFINKYCREGQTWIRTGGGRTEQTFCGSGFGQNWNLQD